MSGGSKTFSRALDRKIVSKKLTNDIWEFRIKYRNLQYRLLAFWDKTNRTQTLVIATHGIIKKTDKLPAKEIEKAENIRALYFSVQN
ncbi:MAG TPA: type II toxin-antitoxin system RelE/ParE family toxin [Chitinophaga sp.]|uniref:type II toxin-antitoxin system RelE/ParE family toxin n=1 Tax=Chitinophaga sp. TaxID=1869181 RepID=UPI002F958ED7